jgi:hypothetical protein
MSASDEHCELCDLPKSQCIHGRPPQVPKPVKPAATKRTPPRKRSSPAPARPVVRRWTPPEEFRPLILGVLEQAGGELDAEDLFLELEIVAEDRLRPGDLETTPEGELRWRYAARRARIALIDEGLMTRTTPGVWKLAGPGSG